MSQFYVFYPHGMSLIEQLVNELRRLQVYALPDPTLANTDWVGLIILNKDSPMMKKWDLHFQRVERLFVLGKDDPEAARLITELDQGTLQLLKEDKDAIRIIQHWERWNWSEAAETLRNQLGLRLNGIAFRKPLSEDQENAIEDYLQQTGYLMRKIREETTAAEAARFQQKLQERIRADEKFAFSLSWLQA